MPRLSNKALPSTTMSQHGGITFHGKFIKPISQIFTIVTDGVQGVPMMAIYPAIYVLINTIGYPMSLRIDENSYSIN
jgi:hypothetical protein